MAKVIQMVGMLLILRRFELCQIVHNADGIFSFDLTSLLQSHASFFSFTRPYAILVIRRGS